MVASEVEVGHRHVVNRAVERLPAEALGLLVRPLVTLLIIVFFIYET